MYAFWREFLEEPIIPFIRTYTFIDRMRKYLKGRQGRFRRILSVDMQRV